MVIKVEVGSVRSEKDNDVLCFDENPLYKVGE